MSVRSIDFNRSEKRLQFYRHGRSCCSGIGVLFLIAVHDCSMMITESHINLDSYVKNAVTGNHASQVGRAFEEGVFKTRAHDGK